MNLKSYPFSKLSFPKLYQDYISQKSEILSFFDTNPLSDNSIESKINSLSYTGNRSELVEILTDFNKRFNPDSETLRNIESLKDSSTYTVVTGQQITLYGGPLFTIYKVLTTIVLAKRYSKKYKKNFIPVFWLADEDHDYEEIASIGIPVGDAMQSLSLNSDSEFEKRVSDIEIIDEEFEKFRNNILEYLPDTDFSNQLWSTLDQCYKSGNQFDDAFGQLLMLLFGKYGLVLAGSNFTPVKEYTKQILLKSVEKRAEIFEKLNSTGLNLEDAGYHKQVHVQESNLFWIDSEKNRIKLQTEGDKWIAERGTERTAWSVEQLLSEINKHPERFSPNVLLRPVLQDELLPVLAYVAGPGEISYYAQMKSMYGEFEKSMPVIFPRFSATVIESGIERIFDKLSFSFSDYLKRIEELESEYIDQTKAPDLEQVFKDWKTKVDDITNSKLPEIINIDPTLENTAGKALATYFSELDKLKGKLYRSLKQQEKIQLSRISKIKNNLFPQGNLQEREVAFIYFMNKYGLDIWDKMLKEFEDEVPDTHKLLYI